MSWLLYCCCVLVPGTRTQQQYNNQDIDDFCVQSGVLPKSFNDIPRTSVERIHGRGMGCRPPVVVTVM